MKTLLQAGLIFILLSSNLFAKVNSSPTLPPTHYAFAEAQELRARIEKLAGEDALAKAQWSFFDSIPGAQGPLAFGVDVTAVPNFEIKNYLGFYFDDRGVAHYGGYIGPFRGYRITISKITGTVTEKYKCRNPDPAPDSASDSCEALYWTTMRIEADVITGACSRFLDCEKLYGIKVRKVWTGTQPATHGGISSAGGD